jgi:hypothetical protein
MQIYELICYPLTLSTLYAWIYRLKHTQKKANADNTKQPKVTACQPPNRHKNNPKAEPAARSKKLKDMKTVFIRFLASGSIE